MITAVGTTLAVGTIGSKLCYDTFSMTCSKALDVMTHIATDKQTSFEDFNTVLTECDLKTKISKIHQLMNEFHDKEQNGHKFKPSVVMAIADVDEAISNLTKTLYAVKDAQTLHKTLYFNTWRKTNCDSMIKSLKSGNLLLNQRFNDLEKVIVISKYLDTI